jgi:hypothetical protein
MDYKYIFNNPDAKVAMLNEEFLIKQLRENEDAMFVYDWRGQPECARCAPAPATFARLAARSSCSAA